MEKEVGELVFNRNKFLSEKAAPYGWMMGESFKNSGNVLSVTELYSQIC